MRKKYNTPKRDQIVKVRLTREEKEAFDEKCRTLRMNHSDYLRSAIFYGQIRAKIYVNGMTEDTFDVIARLNAAYGRIGNNLNQIALKLNSGTPANDTLREALKNALSDLVKLRYETQKRMGEYYGYHKTYEL